MIKLEDVVTLDFESYYDAKLSLRAKAHNTSSYIRDPNFITHCVGIKEGDAETKVYWYEEIAPALHAVRWASKHVLCHNTAFDGFILSHHYGIVPPAAPVDIDGVPTRSSLYLDTLSMARALLSNNSRADLATLLKYFNVPIRKIEGALAKMRGIKYIEPGPARDEGADYCARDVDGTWELFKLMVAVFPDKELELIDLTLRMFCDPVLKLDTALAQRELELEQKRKADLVILTGLDEEELQSSAKLAGHLKAAGVEVPMKESPRTKLMTYAFAQTDDEFIALGAHENPVVRNLVAARLAVKSTIGETRAQRFLTAGADNMPVPVLLNYCGAHTTRWSGGNKMNMQNLPKRGYDDAGHYIPDSDNLRRSLLAPEGSVIVVADSRQIEPRTLGWLAGQWDLVNAFATGSDAYIDQAAYSYRVAHADVTKPQRAVGKATVLGCGYYMGPARFQGTMALGLLGPKMDLTLEECQTAVWGYRKKHDQIVAFWKDMGQVLLRMLTKKVSGNPDECSTYKILQYDAQTIWLPNGLGLHYPELTAEWNDRKERFEDFTYRSHNEYVRIHPGILTENIIQALARIIVAEQMLEIAKRYRVVMMSHDEVAAIAPAHEAQEALDYMIACMRVPPVWAPKLPLDAEGGWDTCYSK